MGAKINLTGKKFNMLTVIEDSGERMNEQVCWLCKCDCGNTTIVRGHDLRSGRVKNCGCYDEKDLIGKTIGKLTVVSRGENDKGSLHVVYNCMCSCGNKCRIRRTHLCNGVRLDCGRCLDDISVGQRFGRLIVTSSVITKEKGRLYYKVKCDCGREKEVMRQSLLRGATISCGCYNREIVSGENNWRYNPNLTKDDRIKIRSMLYGKHQDLWRNKVFARDNYTCQTCNVKSGNGRTVVLNAHHLNGWNWCKEDRFNVENGVTLCVDCHKLFHRTYGYGDNTKSQYETFERSFQLQKSVVH